MKRSVIYLAICLSLCASQVCATRQVDDQLVVDGRQHRASYGTPSVRDLVPIERWDELFPNISTACWRGYVAKWTVIDGVLYLSSVRHHNLPGRPTGEIPLSVINPEWSAPIPATWFSGTISCPKMEIPSRTWVPHYLAYKEFTFVNGRHVGTSLRIPALAVSWPYIAVIVPGGLILIFVVRRRKRKTHNNSMEATTNGAPHG